LGDPSTPRHETPPQQPNRPQTSNVERPAQQASDASRAAGHAALSRMQQIQQPKQNIIQKKVAKELLSEEKEIQKEMQKELQKANELKDHYFNKDSFEKSIETSSHFRGNKINVLYKTAIIPESLENPMRLEDIEQQIQDLLLSNLESEPILTSLTLVLTANYKKGEKMDKGLNILKKLVDNIIANPDEDKYRKVRTENETIKENILSLKYIDICLTNVGFQLKKTQKQGASSSNSDEDMEFVYLFDHENPVNFASLSQLKDAFEMAEAIVPEMDRCVKVFKISNGDQAGHSENKFELSDDFYNVSIDDIKREQKMREEALEKAGMLRTKAMRERDEKLELRKYKFVLVRVKFPNEYYLQAIFRSTETMQQIHLFTQSCLADERTQFQLFGHALKQNYSDSMNLVEAGLAPAALLHFKTVDLNRGNDADWLKRELIYNLKDNF